MSYAFVVRSWKKAKLRESRRKEIRKTRQEINEQKTNDRQRKSAEPKLGSLKRSMKGIYL